MAHRDIVVIGASLGGVEALTRLVSGFPANLGAAVLVVQHTAPDAPSHIAELMDAAGPLVAKPAIDGEPLVTMVAIEEGSITLWAALAQAEERQRLLGELAQHAAANADDIHGYGQELQEMQRLATRLRELVRDPVFDRSNKSEASQ